MAFHLVIEFEDLEVAKAAAGAAGGKVMGIWEKHLEVWRPEGAPPPELPSLPELPNHPNHPGPVWNVGIAEQAEAKDGLK